MNRSWRFPGISSLVLALALWVSCPAQLHAQTVSTGAIAGTVTDPSGSAIPSVNISATEKATASKRKVQTDSSGSYRFSLLPPGGYELRLRLLVLRAWCCLR